MGQLQILAKKETAEKLRGDWQLQEGAVLDFGYIGTSMRIAKSYHTGSIEKTCNLHMIVPKLLSMSDC